MKPKPTSAANPSLRFVLVTLDNPVTDGIERAAVQIGRECPDISVTVHAAAGWAGDPASLERCREDIATGDIIMVTMLFLEDQINAVLFADPQGLLQSPLDYPGYVAEIQRLEARGSRLSLE